MSALRQFEWTERDFQQLTAMARQLAGIELGDNKVELVYSRLVRRVRTLGLDSFAAYCALVTLPGNEEVDYFVDALTTHVTSFFREIHHFDLLERDLWPELQASGRVPRVWSAGCSTGQEPYSLAFSLEQALGARERYEVRGTDISARSIGVGVEGVYAATDVEGMDGPVRRRFFQKGTGARAGLYRVKSSVRENVTFDVESLMTPSSAGRPFDMIMCRNVLIYFAKNTASAICAGLVRRLAPRGWLVLGHSEGGLRLPDEVEQIGPTVYRRAAR